MTPRASFDYYQHFGLIEIFAQTSLLEIEYDAEHDVEYDAEHDAILLSAMEDANQTIMDIEYDGSFLSIIEYMMQTALLDAEYDAILLAPTE